MSYFFQFSALTVSGVVIDGVYSRRFSDPGYYLIKTIPKGSRSINVTELTRTKNYLAVRLTNGNFIFNQNFNIGRSGSYSGAGTKFIYIRQSYSSQESFYTTGMINSSIDVMFIYQVDQPKIYWRYEIEDPTTTTTTTAVTLPFVSQNEIRYLDKSPTAQSSRASNVMMKDEIKSSTSRPRRKGRRMHSWATAGFNRCSKPCGGGYQSTRYICIRERRRKSSGKDVRVSDKFCKSLDKPVGVTVRCNNNSCPPQWEAGPWSMCSVSCGRGTRTRELQCNQEVSEGLKVGVESRLCPQESSLPLREACHMPDCDAYTTPAVVSTKQYVAPPHWKTEEWSPCSATCGDGVRTRVVTCVTSGSPCDPTEQPRSEEICSLASCRTKSSAENEIPEALTETSWMYSAWPESCPAECGTGIKTRRLYCDDYVKNKPCDEQNMPIMNKTCINQTCGQWFVGPWTACSSTCEIGIATREVVCVSRFLGYLKVVDPKNCLGDRPDTTKGCQGPPCNATWFMSDWSRCSRNCGTGVQKRVVKCVGPDGMPIDESVSECDEDKRPLSQRNCNEISCNERRDSDDSSSNNNYNAFGYGKECRDTLSECFTLRTKSQQAHSKCQLEIYKTKCCKACRWLSFISSAG